MTDNNNNKTAAAGGQVANRPRFLRFSDSASTKTSHHSAKRLSSATVS